MKSYLFLIILFCLPSISFALLYQDTSELISEFNIYSEDVYLDGSEVRHYTISPENIPFITPIRSVFRVPSIIVSNAEDFVIAAENREIVNDIAERDIVLGHFNKGGGQFVLKRIWKDNAAGRYNNPSFIIDREGRIGSKGRLFIFAGHFEEGHKYGYDNTTEGTDIVYKYSDDNGMTWSEEVSLKSYWDESKFTAAIPSPANGFIDNNGTIWLPTMVVKDGRWASGILFKHKEGSWTFSSATQMDDNECTVYMDNEGRIILDCRTYNNVRHKYYYDYISDNFTEAPDNIFPFDCINMKEDIIMYEQSFLMTFPDTKSGKRENISLYGSQDGINWIKLLQLMNEDAKYGYSNVSIYNNTMGFVYEAEDGIHLFDLSSFKDKIDQTFVPTSVQNTYKSTTDNIIYDYKGRCLSVTPQKGVYIQKSKKVQVK